MRKLNIELVPSTSWYNNVRSHVTPLDWNLIRGNVYEEYNHRCGVCQAKPKRLDAHEIWSYDDEKSTQTLVGMIALCQMCHHIKHIGYAEVLASQGKLNFQNLISHYCKVNECSLEDFYTDREAAFKQWEERSSREWEVNAELPKRYSFFSLDAAQRAAVGKPRT
jgi:hypothetical protein